MAAVWNAFLASWSHWIKNLGKSNLVSWLAPRSILTTTNVSSQISKVLNSFVWSHTRPDWTVTPEREEMLEEPLGCQPHACTPFRYIFWHVAVYACWLITSYFCLGTATTYPLHVSGVYYPCQLFPRQAGSVADLPGCPKPGPGVLIRALKQLILGHPQLHKSIDEG